MGDTAFIVVVGLVLVAAQYVYAVTGWPPPGLVEK